MLEEIYQYISEIFIKNVQILSTAGEKVVMVLIILLIGYLLGRLISTLVNFIITKILEIDKFIADFGLENALYGKKLSEIVTSLTKWAIYLVFIILSINIIGYSDIANQFADFVKTLFSAIAIFILGLFISEYVKNFLMQITLSEKKLIAHAAKYITIYIFSVLALERFSIDVTIFYDLLRYFALSVAISFGIMLGILLFIRHKNEIEEFIKKI